MTRSRIFFLLAIVALVASLAIAGVADASFCARC